MTNTTTKAADTKAANRIEDMMSNVGERAKEAAEKTAERVEEFVSQAQTRAKAAAERTMELATDATEFQKANAEAMIESAKIAAKGFQDLGRKNAEYARENLENVSNAIQGFASVKSPKELLELQNERARAGFDTLVSQASKNTEAMFKLAGDVFQPLSQRMSLAAEKLRKAA